MDFQAMINNIIETVNTKTVVGDPIEIGNVTLIPVMNAYFGFGGGSGDGKSASGNEQGSGSGGGGGARLKVAGMLVVQDDDVKFLPTGKGGAIDKIVDSLPDLIDKVKLKMDKSDGETEGA